MVGRGGPPPPHLVPPGPPSLAVWVTSETLPVKHINQFSILLVYSLNHHNKMIYLLIAAGAGQRSASKEGASGLSQDPVPPTEELPRGQFPHAHPATQAKTSHQGAIAGG